MMDNGYFEDILGELEPIALAMDKTGDSSHVHLLFRAVHNLKGSVAQVGLEGLSTEVHQLEDALDQIRRGRQTWGSEHYDQVMQVIDKVRLALARTPGPGEQLEPDRSVKAEPVPSRSEPAAGPWGLPLDPEAAGCAQAAIALGQGLYRLDKLFTKGLSRDSFHGLPVMDDLRAFGTLIAVHPTWEAYSEGPAEQVIKLLFASAKGAEALTEVLFDPLIVLREPSAPTPASRRTRLRFLVIEDDPTVAGLLGYILRQHGDCELRETGESGTAAFREAWERDAPFDLIILDLFLPDLHGDAILKEIRAFESERGLLDARSRSIVLINTASTDLNQMRQSLEQEPDGYLIKPIRVELIVDKVAELKTQRL